MVEVKWMPRAQKDLEEIWNHIALDSMRYADETVLRLTDSTLVLREHPRLGKPVPQLGLPDLRELLVRDYRVVYWLEHEDLLHVLTVHRQERLRDPKGLLRSTRALRRSSKEE